MKVFRSPEQLVKIYRASQAGVFTKEIAEAQSISPGSVATALSQLNKYLKGKDRGQSKKSSAYLQAVRSYADRNARSRHRKLQRLRLRL